MGYARYVGRVGALAVALGVGIAVASTPGIAYADPAGDSSSSSGESSSSSSSSTSSGGTDAPSTSGAAGTAPSASDQETGSADPSTVDDDDPDEDTIEDIDDVEQDGDSQEPSQGEGDEDNPPVVVDEDAPPVVVDEDAPPAAPVPAKDDSDQDSASDQATDRQVANRSANKQAVVADPSDDVDATVTTADDNALQARTFSLAAADDAPAQSSAAVFTTVATALKSAVPAPAAPAQPKTLIGVVTEFVAAVLGPLLGAVGDSPIQIPILSAVLSLVRNEFERILAPPRASVASQQTVSLVDPTQEHVLVIGVDGANLSRILADDYNQNFFDLMDTSTTAASSIVGHTTISNPSWTAIMTGVWGERTGVINNVFTPGTYDRFPTVFNQLETLDPDIDTMTVANWNVINAISAAGSVPVDENLYVAQLADDTDWLATDDRVADLTIDAISATDAPNFLFSYYVGVDENGHLYGGASEQYKLAIRNMDDNLGELMDAVEARELLTGEDWTIIVVTDHGHQPQLGFGHGFQSPDETETFVIVDGPDFQDGYINQAYEIVDTTPTVVTLFGGTPLSGSDGVPLQSLGDGVLPANLKQALKDEIAKNKSPDIITNVALSLRTIFATIPYLVYDGVGPLGAGLPSFLILPFNIAYSGLYVATNIPAQIVAFATGVSGASIFPLFPPAQPDFPPAPDEATMLESAAVAV